MKMLALFQSGLLMAVYITLNLPTNSVGVYLFPDDLALFQSEIYDSMRTVAIFCFAYFMILFYVHEPDHEKPASVFFGIVIGPIGVHLAANEALWRKMDDGLRLLIVIVTVLMLPILLLKKGWINAMRLVLSSVVFVSAFAFGLYCDNGEYSWVMLFASVVIVLPDILVGVCSSKIREI